MINARRRCSAEFALAALGLRNHGELAALVRAGRLPRPTVEEPDFDFEIVEALARVLDAERCP